MARRYGMAIAIGSAAALAWVAACSFPDVRFEPDDAGGGSPDGSGGVDGDGELDAAIDAAVVDAVTRDDASQRVDEAGCKSPCDCDEDTFFNRTCDAGPDAAYDCDDFDPLVHPGQTWVGDVPTAPNQGDWNCDGRVDRAYESELRCAIGSCAGRGFTDTPGCGVERPYYACQSQAVVGCGPVKIDDRVQLCR